MTKYVALRQFVSPVLGHISKGQEVAVDVPSADTSLLTTIQQLIDLGDLAEVVEPVAEETTDSAVEPKSDPGPSETPTLNGPSEDK